MRNIIFILSILGLAFSCTEATETKFEREGVSLTCPKGWKITEQENIEDQGFYLSMEKEGLDASGLVSISWVNNELALEDWLDIYREELANNIIYKNSNLTFSDPYEAEYNGLPSQAMTFTVSIIGLKHEGIVHAFYGADKTIAVLRQEAIEDSAENKEGFASIESSFTIKTNDGKDL
jgi:hypothetical protein